ncbi:DNA mismatch repair protein MutT [Chryseobacterium lactis]|uniref:DNA mismatch repair protein MutT n=1 Tax=Chryseobacterium lactis TaxID=1241981 RepID=A0A3G6RPI2_CHRLC|nr:NUDIX domain-containing protein [Chryseobacterium lactis]AZA80751.1 NUDIX domain-containing protein [Chryseobacterium lactis]AZB05753.1 NUDIX domain-containing protein [Chryseobacterium lactis]PNW13528.1 DNA mismatch repair protein MutT [Chryseobacterium lactis]
MNCKNCNIETELDECPNCGQSVKPVVIDKLAWIELKNKSILSTKSYGKDKYYIPGGKREAGENDEQALMREINEELNVEIDRSTIEYIGTFEAQAHGHAEGIIVKMTCYAAKYSGELKASSEIEEMKWLSYSDKDKTSEVDKIIFYYLHNNNLLD